MRVFQYTQCVEHSNATEIDASYRIAHNTNLSGRKAQGYNRLNLRYAVADPGRNSLLLICGRIGASLQPGDDGTHWIAWRLLKPRITSLSSLREADDRREPETMAGVPCC